VWYSCYLSTENRSRRTCSAAAVTTLSLDLNGPQSSQDLPFFPGSLANRDALVINPGVPEPAAPAVSEVPGELLIRFQPGVTRADITDFHADHGLSELENLDADRTDRDEGVKFVATPMLQAQELIPVLQQDSRVRYAEQNYVVSVAGLPNDPTFQRDCGLLNRGQTGGAVDADMAWDITRGSSEIVVAVIDTGVDSTHPDLAANLWTNPREIPSNKKDDDSNGFVDDVHGYDFGNNDGDPMDEDGHGTHVAGTPGHEGWHVDNIQVIAPGAPPAGLAINDVTVGEGNDGTARAVFTVTRSSAAGAASVQFATADDSATVAGGDYVSETGTLSRKPFSVLINGDRLGEADEGFVVNLTSPTGAVIADGQGKAVILDDEPRIHANFVVVVEETTEVLLAVNLSVPGSQTVTVSYATADWNATAGSDYDAVAGTLTFNPGETRKTIPIRVRNNNDQAPAEVFFIDFNNVSNNAVILKRGTVVILSDTSNRKHFGNRSTLAGAVNGFFPIAGGDQPGSASEANQPASLFATIPATASAAHPVDSVWADPLQGPLNSTSSQLTLLPSWTLRSPRKTPRKKALLFLSVLLCVLCDSVVRSSLHPG
jgi:hypothetical protein